MQPFRLTESARARAPRAGGHRDQWAWRWRLALAALLAWFLIIALRHLTVVPPVYEDEPWFASTAWKLATDGIFGSDVFAGLSGMERHYFGFPPVGPLLLAGTFRLGGFGLLQLRAETVVLGSIALVLTYVLGRRLFSRTVGMVAVALLLVVRTEAVGRTSPTGIFFLDVSRTARYDMPVAVFGLSALLAYLSARDLRLEHGRGRRLLMFGAAGLLAALSSLSHLYGAFWFVALGVLAVWDRAGWRALAALATGFALPWAAYALYILQDASSWTAQTRGYGPRFGLGDPLWYWRNLVTEPFRYAPGLGQASFEWLLRPGLWMALVLVPASLVALARRARIDRDARALAVPAVIIPALFALLISVKFRNYKIAFVPLFALAAAWGTCALWRARSPRVRQRWRPVMLVLAAVAATEGIVRVAALERLAATTTPYASYVERIRVHVPPGTRVLGLHHYWIGFEDTDYRSWFVPLVQSGGRYREPTLPMDKALSAIDPEIVLLDPRMRAFLEEPPPSGDRRRAEVRDWMRGWSIEAAVDDPTYGRMEIYRRR